MNKHAYLILAHTNFNQLRKLIETLDDERNDIFVHVDKKATGFNPEDFSNVCKKSRLVFLPERIKVNWGGVSIMRAELALLKAATSTDRYRYYHLLSGLDFPLKSQDEIHRFFNENNGKEFISLWPIKKSMISRFRYFTVFPEGEKEFRTRIINHIVKGLQMMSGIKINRGVDFKVGSQWFSITDDFARYVVSKEDWLEKTFRRTSTCDEVFMQTLIWTSPYKDKLYSSDIPISQKELKSGNMRLIDWTRGESVRHPWTFRITDKEMLSNSDHLWARKFDERVDAEIIEWLYKNLRRT